MNGETRPARVRSLRSGMIISLRHNVTRKFTKGEELNGYINQYGNVYDKTEVYLGSIPLDFKEVT